MYDIEIKKGRTFRYDLWYGGEPPPNVIWERNGIVLQGLRVRKLGKTRRDSKSTSAHSSISFVLIPPPKLRTLFRRSMPVKPDERTSMEIFAKKTVYCERNTVVTVVKADRAVDTGTYKIRLVCEGGTFEVLNGQNRALVLAFFKNLHIR